MKIYDISRSLLSSDLYPGDPPPVSERIQRMEMGDECNLSTLYSSLHTGTHADAPYHYFEDGRTIDRLSLGPFIGECLVASASGYITGSDVEIHIPRYVRRLLIKGGGGARLTVSAASAIVDLDIVLVGTDALSIAAEKEEASVHRELMRESVMILEGLNLSHVPNGRYFLFAPPVLVGQTEAAPVRAVLIEGLNITNIE